MKNFLGDFWSFRTKKTSLSSKADDREDERRVCRLRRQKKKFSLSYAITCSSLTAGTSVRAVSARSRQCRQIYMFNTAVNKVRFLHCICRFTHLISDSPLFQHPDWELVHLGCTMLKPFLNNHCGELLAAAASCFLPSAGPRRGHTSVTNTTARTSSPDL